MFIPAGQAVADQSDMVSSSHCLHVRQCGSARRIGRGSEFQSNSRDLTRVRNDSVFPAVFLAARRPLLPRRAGLLVESLPVDYLKEDLMDVHRVSVSREVVDRPDFSVTRRRILAN